MDQKKGLVAILAIKEVSKCRTRGESEEFIAHRQGSTEVRDTPWLLNPGQIHQKFKIAVSVPPLISSNIFKRKQQNFILLLEMCGSGIGKGLAF